VPILLKKKRSYMRLNEPLAIEDEYWLIVAAMNLIALTHKVLWPNQSVIDTVSKCVSEN
jgi:hypothetical protein